METTRYTGKELAQLARDTVKAHHIKLASWEIVVHNEGASLQVRGTPDAEGSTTIIAVAL